MREIETRVWKILNDARILKTRSHLGVERETKRNRLALLERVTIIYINIEISWLLKMRCHVHLPFCQIVCVCWLVELVICGLVKFT
jgi:hypothetical protein